MFARLLPLLKLAAAIVLALALIDAALFRSGIYWRVAEPESTAGTTLGAVYAARELYDSRRKNILVLGNSQIGEGFSALTADATSGRPDLHFINAAIPGTTPRVWNYVLRTVDPHAKRYAAVVLMAYYDTFGIQTDPANYPLDASYLAPLLRIGDMVTFPSSFHSDEQRQRAWRAVLLPLQTIREDVLAFLTKPSERLDKVRGYYPGWLAAVQQYGGHGEAIPVLDIDSSTGQPRSWDGVPGDMKQRLQDYIGGLHAATYGTPQLQADADSYARQWIGQIAQRYHKHGIPVIVFVVPRGPYHAQLTTPPRPTGAMAELRDAGLIRMLPGNAFTQFEYPRFFFDTLHMNHSGREAFSASLALKVAPLVP